MEDTGLKIALSEKEDFKVELVNCGYNISGMHIYQYVRFYN